MAVKAAACDKTKRKTTQHRNRLRWLTHMLLNLFWSKTFR